MTTPIPKVEPPVARPSTYLGLFLVTLATLAYQILLTRIFSVTIWYHFAFLAISIAMLGMTIGAVTVYLLPNVFDPLRVHRQLAASAFVFALSIVGSLVFHLSVPVNTDGSAGSILAIALTCAVIAIPFTASGVCVALALTRFPAQASRLYAVDLAGAALGCLALVVLLRVTDAPTAVVAVAALAGFAALCFEPRDPPGRLRTMLGASALALAAFAVGHALLVQQQQGLLRVRWGVVNGRVVPLDRPLFEGWNTHSRIRVFGRPEVAVRPFGWSMSPTLPDSLRARQLFLDIDSGALTVMTAFDGSLEPLEHLRYDITNLAHHLRRDADVLVIGSGGGRDVLSSLVFEQASVTALEINGLILDVVHDRFGDFTGHLDRHPNVRFVHDEARSYMARSKDRFDIIQISLIDSWAATAAGAFVLTENALYTVEAWKIFLEHLRPGGILTVTRDYLPEDPATAERLTSLAVAALRELGVESPRDHIALAYRESPMSRGFGMGTILVSRDPFSAADLATLDETLATLRFDPALTPRFSVNDTFRRVVEEEDLSALYASLPLDISPSRDDRPFFFHMLRFRDVFDAGISSNAQGIASFNLRAVSLLGILLITVTLLTLGFVIAPLLLRRPPAHPRTLLPYMLLFSGIGAGFMLVEISQMQRLTVFLGHPVYALTVVLFTLLLFSGVGSFTTQGIRDDALPRAAAVRFALLLGTLAAFGLLTPLATSALAAAATPVRILTSVALLAPIGLLMGMPFPIGIRFASRDANASATTPWLWGINGATSVVASVLAVVIAMSAGISAAFWTGFLCYGLAAVGLAWQARVRAR
ncbi:MAG TPA: class I SAM-dependent methyltransferase [Myxococcota bacterium]|jgi:SAM-dependent methyltransferase